MSVIKPLLLALAFAGSCSVVARPDAGPPVEAVQPGGMPDLCSYSVGYCEPCGGAGMPSCPQGDSGALCCSGDVCVIWSGSHCSGDLGWCSNYTKEVDPATGVTVATCHDDQGES